MSVERYFLTGKTFIDYAQHQSLFGVDRPHLPHVLESFTGEDDIQTHFEPENPPPFGWSSNDVTLSPAQYTVASVAVGASHQYYSDDLTLCVLTASGFWSHFTAFRWTLVEPPPESDEEKLRRAVGIAGAGAAGGSAALALVLTALIAPAPSVIVGAFCNSLRRRLRK